MTVAIDGPAGSGKSTIARKVAEATGFFYLNSGAFYRAITWNLLESGIDAADVERIVSSARSVHLEIASGGLRVDGRYLSTELRSRAVDQRVAQVSSEPRIRAIVNARLLELARTTDVIAEGRDMTTVVFPDADLKFFLDASLDARARRRHEDAHQRASIEEIRDQIASRDEIDSTKPVGRLKVDPRALYIDTSDLTLDQVYESVLQTIQSRINKQRGADNQS